MFCIPVFLQKYRRASPTLRQVGYREVNPHDRQKDHASRDSIVASRIAGAVPAVSLSCSAWFSICERFWNLEGHGKFVRRSLLPLPPPFVRRPRKCMQPGVNAKLVLWWVTQSYKDVRQRGGVGYGVLQRWRLWTTLLPSCVLSFVCRVTTFLLAKCATGWPEGGIDTARWINYNNLFFTFGKKCSLAIFCQLWNRE